MTSSLFTNQKGIAIFLVIIIIAATVLILSSSSLLLGLGESEMSFMAQKGGEAFFLADGCAEESLRRLKLDPTAYVGGSLNLGNGSCIITILPDGQNRTVTAESSLSDSYHKKIEIGLTLSGVDSDIITINSWQEKSD